MSGIINSAGSKSGVIGIQSSPTQSAFWYAGESTQTSVTSEDTVVFDTKKFDNANNFSSNTFTAPIKGVYHFSWIVNVQTLDTASNWVTTQLITTADNINYVSMVDPGQFAAAPDYWPHNGTITCDMDAGHTALVQIKWSLSGGLGHIRTDRHFSGFLIG